MLKTVEQMEHEVDQRFVRGAEIGAVKGAVAEAAAEIEALGGSEAAEKSGDAIGKGSGPNGVETEHAGENGRRRRGERSAAEATDGRGFASGVEDPLGGEGLFDFEDGVDAFGRDVRAGIVVKEQRRIEVIVDGDVDLSAAMAAGIDDESAGGAVALGQIAIEQVEPVLFGGGSAGSGVLEDLARGEIGEHLLLNVEEDPAEIDAAGIGVLAHGPGLASGVWERAGVSGK